MFPLSEEVLVCGGSSSGGLDGEARGLDEEPRPVVRMNKLVQWRGWGGEAAGAGVRG